MYKQELEERKIKLQRIIEKINRELPEFPEGNLRIQQKGGSSQYFLITKKGDTHGKYIKACDRELVKKLAQRSYYEKLLKSVQAEERALSLYLSAMTKAPEDIYSSMKVPRKELISPLLISDEDFAQNWENIPYEKNPYHPEERIHPTEKGDLVRSKSEARIADMYYQLGIPYRYEAPLKLKNGKVKYPDFTLLKFPERKEYYHEHMGCMEEDGYRESNIIKLSEYAESGISTINNLILTFETDYSPLNIKYLRNNVKKVFLE